MNAFVGGGGGEGGTTPWVRLGSIFQAQRESVSCPVDTLRRALIDGDGGE